MTRNITPTRLSPTDADELEKLRAFANGISGRLMNIKIDLQTGKSKQDAIYSLAKVIREIESQLPKK